MNRFMAILGLAVISLSSPMTGHAQFIHRSHFKIDKLSTRQSAKYTYVDGEITNNAKQAATGVHIAVRWFDKNGNVLDAYYTTVTDLAPGQTLPFRAWTSNNPEIVRSNISIDSIIDSKGWLRWAKS